MKTPVAILDRLFGRKPQDSTSLSARLDATRIALDEARQRQASADDRCKAAMVSADRPAFLSAKADGEAAEFDAGVASGEVEALSAALAAAIEAEQAAARAAAVAALVERRRALGIRFDTEWRDAAAVMAGILSEAKTLQRDVAEAGFGAEVERLSDIARGLPMHDEAVGNVSRWLGDALAGLPTVPESPKEASFREAEEARARRKAEEAEARRVQAEAEREEGRIAREAEDAKARERARDPYYPSRQAMSDAAR